MLRVIIGSVVRALKSALYSVSLEACEHVQVHSTTLSLLINAEAVECLIPGPCNMYVVQSATSPCSHSTPVVKITSGHRSNPKRFF